MSDDRDWRVDTPAQALAAGLRAMLWEAGVPAEKALVRGVTGADGFPSAVVTLRWVEEYDEVRGLLEREGWGVLTAGPTELVAWRPGEDPEIDAPT